MAVSVTWPSAKFGTPLLDHAPVLVDPVVRTPMEVGDKARRSHELMLFRSQFKLIMTGEEYKYLLSWIDNKIDGGATWFGMSFRTGDTNNTEEVRLTSAPSFKYYEVERYEVTLSIEMRTNSIPAEATLDTWLAS